jgi:hypothetical protein
LLCPQAFMIVHPAKNGLEPKIDFVVGRAAM